LQVTLCDPYLSALSVRYYKKTALYKYTYLPTYHVVPFSKKST